MRGIRCFIAVALTMGIALVQTGCWDRVEIEKHAFILGIGLDIPEKQIKG